MALQWLLPLGFLSLLGIGVLILIYIIKPTYQKRLISSSYAWQKVLKRKKELPIDKFSNLILFICQALILAACAMIFAQPNLMSPEMLDSTVERICIVDASASMRAHNAGDQEGITRFERALDEVRMALNDVIMKENGLVSVVIADDDPYFLADRADRSTYSDVVNALNGLTCSNGHADMQKALDLVGERSLNSSAEIVIYSATEYGDMGDAVTTVNLSDIENEWNISVLGCDVVTEGNEFVFNISLGAYGNVSVKKNMTVDIKGADLRTGELRNLPTLTIPVEFKVNSESAGYEQKQTVSVCASDESIKGGRIDYIFTSFQEAEIRIDDLNDSISDDDSMTVYGGVKDAINIQYCSSETTVFYYLGYAIIRNGLRNLRDINFDQLEVNERPTLEGYDIYIFEHTIPDNVIAFGLPTDGVIFLVDPDKDVEGMGIKFGDKVSFKTIQPLKSGKKHPLTNYMVPSRNGVTAYTKVIEYDDDYVPLLYCGEDPVLLVKDTPSFKTVVMPFSLNMSDIISWDFETLLYNMITYFFPLTVTQYNYEYGDTALLNCKGESLVIANQKTSYVMRAFPTELVLDELGTFTFTVHSGFKDKPDEVRRIMVRIPHSESALFDISNVRITLDRGTYLAKAIVDLFPYFAIFIIVLLFIEWWLQFRSEA